MARNDDAWIQYGRENESPNASDAMRDVTVVAVPESSAESVGSYLSMPPSQAGRQPWRRQPLG